MIERLFSRKRTLELARGFFERLEYRDDEFTIVGWMLLPEKHFDSVTLYIDQHKVENCATVEREDVAQAFPFIPHAKNSGFSFSLPGPVDAMDRMLDICVVGVSRGREIAKIETWYRTDLYSGLPTPPTHLISRVAAHEGRNFYMVTGMHTYREFWTAICKYAEPHSIESMLDWGCGCGRVLGFFSRYSGIPRIYGCDIDAEAISWCNDNLKPAEFSTVSPYPPTAYADGAFDLIVSFSVFTHLSKETQFSWLKEMQRLLIPGGLFLTTVHGEFATAFSFPSEKIEHVLKDGIFEVKDERLDGIAPEGYYRGTYQGKEYTLREWSSYFEILEYKERGASNFQDLVVMRRRSAEQSGSHSLDGR
jgi:SAM-dependent methyltransferase